MRIDWTGIPVGVGMDKIAGAVGVGDALGLDYLLGGVEAWQNGTNPVKSL